MTDRCPPPEELARLAAMPRGDPRRAHIDDCPRCEGVLLSYEEFLAPGALPGEALAARASEQLEALLRTEIQGPCLPRRRRGRLRSLARLPVLAPAMAVAAAVVLLLVAQDRPGEPGGAGLRSGPSAGASGVAAPVAASAREGHTGRVVLEWEPPTGCDRSLVVLYGADMAETARLDVAGARAVELPGAGEEASQAVARYWRVLCLRGTEEISRSTIRELAPTGP